MTYAESVRRLLNLLGSAAPRNFGLERIEALMDRLDHPERAFRVVHVAGTNGKGSTAAMIEAGLRAAGRSTGFYSSPHLSRFNERIRINAAEIDDEGFARAVAAVLAAAESALVAGDELHGATLFECATASALWAFREAGVEWGIVEVGLGGRLDATNVVSAELAVIMPISFDHERFLGRGAASIAAEKAGILKPGCRVVVAPQPAGADKAISRRAAELGVEPISVAERWRAENVQADEEGRFRFDAVSAERRVAVRLGLRGEHQVGNALVAVAALDALGLDDDAVAAGLAAVSWPGRLELLPRGPRVLLDCAHNPAGARTLRDYLERFAAGKRLHLVYGAARDKAIEETAGQLTALANTVVLTQSKVSRSVRPATLAALLDHLHPNLEVADSVAEAVARARQAARPEDWIVVAGSIFLVGEARELLLTAAPVLARES